MSIFKDIFKKFKLVTYPPYKNLLEFGILGSLISLPLIKIFSIPITFAMVSGFGVAGLIITSLPINRKRKSLIELEKFGREFIWLLILLLASIIFPLFALFLCFIFLFFSKEIINTIYTRALNLQLSLAYNSSLSDKLNEIEEIIRKKEISVKISSLLGTIFGMYGILFSNYIYKLVPTMVVIEIYLLFMAYLLPEILKSVNKKVKEICYI